MSLSPLVLLWSASQVTLTSQPVCRTQPQQAASALLLALVRNTPVAHFPCRLARLPLVGRLPLALAVAVLAVPCLSLRVLLLPMVSVAR
jgi:hypothetical protein